VLVKYREVVQTIVDLCKSPSLTFSERSLAIVHLLDDVPQPDVLDHLHNAGIIPESFGHDSTEEKLFAKYCDALLARSLTLLGMETHVIAERADAADVSATLQGYTVVGDAKAFRLSRTAKNQKDFKVGALDTWRKGAEYACLVAPLYQYPTTKSQIYNQASRYNVTLLSYNHLAYLLVHQPKKLPSLKRLWEIGKNTAKSTNAKGYWDAVATTLCDITATSKAEWARAIDAERKRLPALASDQIAYWDKEKGRIRKLSHDVAVTELIAALKIDSKIATIRKKSTTLKSFLPK
jgi:hypothetical protein